MYHLNNIQQFNKETAEERQTKIENLRQSDDWQIKFDEINPEVQKWMTSLESATANKEIAEKFGLDKDDNPILAEITGLIAIKDYPISSLPELLKRELDVSDSQAEEIALEVVKKQFLPLRQYMPEVEEFLNQIGEIRQKPAQTPPPFSEPAKEQKPAKIIEQIQIPQKSIREAAKINENVLDQFITFEPIMIKSAETGEERKTSPTIRNWLRDYIGIKGSSAHTEMDRSDYLFNSPNASRLTSEERNLLSEFLKSFDDSAHKIPFSAQTKLFEIEKLMKRQTGEERKTFSAQGMVETPAEKQDPIPFRPQAVSASPVNGTDKYLEPIEKDDKPRNIVQFPKPPASKDQGRIINLKDLR